MREKTRHTHTHTVGWRNRRDDYEIVSADGRPLRPRPSRHQRCRYVLTSLPLFHVAEFPFHTVVVAESEDDVDVGDIIELLHRHRIDVTLVYFGERSDREQWRSALQRLCPARSGAARARIFLRNQFIGGVAQLRWLTISRKLLDFVEGGMTVLCVDDFQSVNMQERALHILALERGGVTRPEPEGIHPIMKQL